MTPEETQDLDDLTLEYEDNYPLFAREQLKIRPKKPGPPIPLEFNFVQTYVHKKLEKQKAKTGRVRALILKGRQQGISTEIEGRFFHLETFGEGLRAFILTHEQDATNNLFEMVERYQANVDPAFRNKAKISNAKEMLFEATDCGYKVGTAGTKGVGRSFTGQLFHGSEVAFWPHADTHSAGVIQAIPNEPGTEIILESTANGVGNYFHQAWLDAVNGKSEYQAIFIPWYWQFEYRAPYKGTEEVTPAELEEEAQLRERFGLDDNQIQWRRDKIDELKSKDKFKQEYPCHWREAFLFSGRKYFPAEALERQESHVREPIAVGVLEQSKDTLIFKEQSNGYLEIFEYPKEDEDYVIGGDIATGEAEGGPGSDDEGDANVGHVFKRGNRFEQVARFTPIGGADDMGRCSVLVAEYYGGRVPVGLERTGVGLTAVVAARDTGYKHLLHTAEGKEATTKAKKKTKLGWDTTPASRPGLCAKLLEGIRDGWLVLRSESTLSEFSTFITGSGGRPEGAEGCHDDEVFAAGIALQTMLRTKPIPRDDGEPSGPPMTGPLAWMVS
jgi:hypothetical protein